MARFFPPLDQIRKLRVPPEPGELYLLEFLQNNLNDSYEVYFQPFLNGDRPDIILMRRNSGVLIIEVKDWRLKNYSLYDNNKNQWKLISDNNAVMKSPIAQVEAYKENLYYLHIDSLLEEKILNPKIWAIVCCAVYFHNETENSIQKFLDDVRFNQETEESIHNPSAKETKLYTRLLGRDSLTKPKFINLLYDLGIGRHSLYFDDSLYQSFKRHLQPPVHMIEQGKPITYSKEQLPLTQSQAREQKVLGVAGSGKTFILAKRAVNAHVRTKSRILILTFNITLRNYIHDRISEVREQFEWNNFYITHSIPSPITD